MIFDSFLNPIVTFLLTIATAIGTSVGNGLLVLAGDEILAGVSSGFSGVFDWFGQLWTGLFAGSGM